MVRGYKKVEDCWNIGMYMNCITKQQYLFTGKQNNISDMVNNDC